MKTKFITKIRLLILLIAMAIMPFFAGAQMPAAITIEPENATAYDELTLTFDPQLACFQSGSLEGLPFIAMHSGVTYLNGPTWQNIVEFNQTGYNGQSTLLYPTGDGKFSITYIPSEFYGLNGQSVSQICAVFNNAFNWDQDGRDYYEGGPECMDFFIPLNCFGSNPSIHFEVNMIKMIEDGNFDPATDSVFTRISLPATIRLEDLEGDGIYQGIMSDDLQVQTTYAYKFRVNEDFYEDVTRSITTGPGTVKVAAWWNDEPSLTYSQTIADFEDGTTGLLTLHVMGCGEYDLVNIHPVSETFYIVENPAPSELNQSEKVLKFIRRGLQWGAEPWGGFFANCIPAFDATYLKIVHVKVLKPRISPLRFKIEGGVAGTFEIESVNQQSLTGEWEEFIFDFSFTDGIYPLIALMPDFEDPLTLYDDMEMYIDDIQVNNIPYPIYVGAKDPVGKMHEESINIYPNPATDFLNIISSGKIKSLEIYDITGRMVFNNNYFDDKTTLNISGFKPGMYMLKFQATDGSVSSQKLVKY